MRHGCRQLLAAAAASLTLASTMLLTAAPVPAAAAAPPPPTPIAVPLATTPPPADPGALIVGLRTGGDVAAVAERVADAHDITVLDSDRIDRKTATVEVPAVDGDTAMAALRRDPAVAFVERDHQASVSAAITTNDYLRGDQWGLDRIAAPAAWQLTTGSAAVTVAVIDTGVNTGVTGNPDLPAGRIVPGYDFVNTDTDASDDHGHGTMVANVIAGTGNDAGGGYHGGTAGLCWTCKIMPIKVLDQDGSGGYGQIAAGITWATDHGADIINMSLGGAAGSTALTNAVNYAVAHGVLVLAAAGNDGVSTKEYPAAIPAAVSVGATTASDTRYEWSNYGATWVDIAAPGCTMTGGRYQSWYSFCGTSAATPFAAGVAALALAEDPTATGAQLAAALTDTADDLPTGWTAHGRINALAAVASFAPAGLPEITAGRPGVQGLVRASTAVRAEATDTDGVASASMLVNGAAVSTLTGPGPFNFVLPTAGLPRYSGLTIVVEDTVGNRSAFASPLIVDNTAPAMTVAAVGTNGGLVRRSVVVPTSVSDTSGASRVTLSVNNTLVSTDRSAPFRPYWNSAHANGTVTLTVRAYDRAGNGRATSRRVTVDNTQPSLTVLGAPRSGRRLSGTYRIAARAGDHSGISRVELVVNGHVAARDTSRSYGLTLRSGQYGSTLRAYVRAYDRAGNVRLSRTWTWRH